MAVKVSNKELAQLCDEFDYHIPSMVEAMRERFPGYTARADRVTSRINNMREKGILPLDSGNYVSSGEVLKGSSTLYDEKGGIKLQWVKTDVEKKKQLDGLKELIDNYIEDLPQFQKKEYDVTYTSNELMAVYPLGDPHIGLATYKNEVGEDWDLKTAQEVLCGVFNRLVKTTPHCKTAVIVNLGDYFHRDNIAGVTERNRHVLDTSGNYMMMVDTGLKIMVEMINTALEHHEKVRVITTIGNHDDTAAMFLQASLNHMYAHEPRVEAICNGSVYEYFTHGSSFFGVHHGHTCKPDKLPLVMAVDKPEQWGAAKHRYWLTGHIHHDSRKEYSGCVVESFRTLAAKDNYAHSHGYRAGQDSKALVIHEKFGEIERHTINISQVLQKQ